MGKDKDYLTAAQVAELIGVERGTVADYLSKALNGKGTFPEPDKRYGRTPLWLPETIEAWLAERPGPGFRSDLVADTGRPRHARRRKATEG